MRRLLPALLLLSTTTLPALAEGPGDTVVAVLAGHFHRDELHYANGVPIHLCGPVVNMWDRQTCYRHWSIANGTLSPNLVSFINACVEARVNMIISGGTGTGKTTLLNVVSAFIPNRERILTIEDTAELQMKQEHVGRLEKRPPNVEGKGEVTIRQLVINALRMRPDRIIVGEARGGEALDMLQAMNTGHDGSMTTIHSNSPRDTLRRIETMVLMAGMELPIRAIREQVGSAVHLICQISRFADGSRKVSKVTEVSGLEGDRITLQDIFDFKQTGLDESGMVQGGLHPTGAVPTFIEEIATRGIPFDRTIFETAGQGHNRMWGK